MSKVDKKGNPMWDRYDAYNQETLYGWTSNEAVAEAALAWINRGREINVYSMTCLGDDENEADDQGTRLVDKGGHIFVDDTSPEEFELRLLEWQEESRDSTAPPKPQRRVDRLTVDLPSGTLAALKVHVAQRETTIRNVVTHLVKMEIGK